jgi:S-adenosylmethionine-diacylglycerol 3-amino-3-carboxypropyl transferase
MICAPPSDLGFSQVREDPTIELRIIKQLAQTQNHPLRLLLIASGGCTVLSLLTCSDVAQIDAVDLNPAQLHLVELRRQALLHLLVEEQLELIGAKSVTQAERVDLYNKIASKLPTSTQNYWDARIEQIAFGVNRVGKFEQLFRELSASFTASGLNPLRNPDTTTDPRWRQIFESVFERHKLVRAFGEAAVNYSMDRSFGEHFADVFAKALHKYTIGNYFLTQVWSDSYSYGFDGVPLYLQPEAQSSIRELGTSRLKLHHGAFAQKMLELGAIQPFDLIQFSNISDWMPPSDLDNMLKNALACLKPGGALIGRRLNGDHHLASVMAKHIYVDENLSHELLESDRSFFYREVVVGWKM